LGTVRRFSQLGFRHNTTSPSGTPSAISPPAPPRLPAKTKLYRPGPPFGHGVGTSDCLTWWLRSACDGTTASSLLLQGAPTPFLHGPFSPFVRRDRPVGTSSEGVFRVLEGPPPPHVRRIGPRPFSLWPLAMFLADDHPNENPHNYSSLGFVPFPLVGPLASPETAVFHGPGVGTGQPGAWIPRAFYFPTAGDLNRFGASFMLRSLSPPPPPIFPLFVK